MIELQNHIIQFGQSFVLNEKDIIAKLSSEKNWESRYRQIMLLGKNVPAFSEQLKVDSALVQGCESKVWLHYLWRENKLLLAASSDAKIVKGLITIVLAGFNQKEKSEIHCFDVVAYFEKLNLTNHLSPSRTNGLFAIVTQIKSL